MLNGYRIAFFGSSLLSSYWNGAATYYRGILKEIARRGATITFYEPDAYQRQQHRDIAPPDWAEVMVYPGQGLEGLERCLEHARGADLIVKASGVGVFDELLEAAVLTLREPDNLIAFWDVDAPATLDRIARSEQDPFRELLGEYDLIFTYGGGDPVVRTYKTWGARNCIPIYNALDPETHFRVATEARFHADVGFLGNRLPDREARVTEFFFDAARQATHSTFLLGGSGWSDRGWTSNVRYVGHVGTANHNAFHSSTRCVLNISRESMARYGYSPATRVFEAAGAAACLITDEWRGVDLFLEPGVECLVARNGTEVAELVASVGEAEARIIGHAALKRVLAEHTYQRRALQFEAVVTGSRSFWGAAR